MNPIMTETRSTKVTDYYATTNDPEVDEASLAAQEHSKTADALLQKHMKGSLQAFQGSMTATNETNREEQFKKSVAEAETVKKGLGQYASQPGIDMNSLMLEMNGLLSKMRDLQRDHAIQQQQQALTMQEKAYEKNKESIEKEKSAANTKMGWGMAGAALGVAGGFGKGFGNIRKTFVENKQAKINKLMTSDSNMTEKAAFSKLKENEPGIWQKTTNYCTPNSLGGLDKSIHRNNNLVNSGEMSGALSSLGAPIGELAAAPITAEAKNFQVEADRDKGLQQLNEKEHSIREEQSREASQKMRDVQREMNELYGKISSAVRW